MKTFYELQFIQLTSERFQNDHTSTLEAMRFGAIFGGTGALVGAVIPVLLRAMPKIPPYGTPPTFPVAPRIDAPYATQLGNTVSNTIGGTPSFIPLDPNVNGVKK